MIEIITGYLSADVVLFLVSALLGERIGAYAGLAWRAYRRVKSVKGFIVGLFDGGANARLSRLEKALKAVELTPEQRKKLSDSELAVLTNDSATLKTKSK